MNSHFRATVTDVALVSGATLLNRYLFKVHALAAADPAALIEATAPVIEHYLTGDLEAGCAGQLTIGRRRQES